MHTVLIQNPKKMILEEFDLVLEPVYFPVCDSVY